MRFWHPTLLQQLPNKKLSTLHASLCRVRSRPWGKPTPKTWYYNLSWGCLVWYHSLVIREMQGRGWRVLVKWLDYTYRGRGNEPAPGEYVREGGHLKELEAIVFDPAERQRRDLDGRPAL